MTRQPLAAAVVTLVSTNGHGMLKTESGVDGRFAFELEKNAVYRMTANKIGFLNANNRVWASGLNKSTELRTELYLEPIALNKVIRPDNIYYDFDKADIMSDASIGVDKLVKVILDNTTICIELGSHTDTHGDERHSLDLSQRRADAVMRYIIRQGIDKNRFNARGYGESRLLNHCANGVKCPNAEHQLNSRTEFMSLRQ